MTKRTAKSYEALFRFIERKVFRLKPSEIITDFEGGLRKALKIVYPNIILRGCWFHYCQAIRKKCRKLGLQSFFESNIEAHNIYHQLLILPLLPPENFSEGYGIIKRRARAEGLLQRLRSLFNYFDSYWLPEVRISAYILY